MYVRPQVDMWHFCEQRNPACVGQVLIFNLLTERWSERENVRPGCNRKGSVRSMQSGCACGPLLVRIPILDVARLDSTPLDSTPLHSTRLDSTQLDST